MKKMYSVPPALNYAHQWHSLSDFGSAPMSAHDEGYDLNELLRSRPGTGPSEEQLAVIEAQDRRILVLAGPGSGKTTTIVGCIVPALDKGRTVRALSFTRAAAEVCRERVAAKVRHCIEGQFKSQTIHGFAIEMQRLQDPETNLMGKGGTIALARMVLSSGRWPKDIVEKPFSFIEKWGTIVGDFSDQLVGETKFIQKLIQTARRLKVIPLGLVVKMTLIDIQEERMSPVECHELFIDESQDTDRAQWALLRTIKSESVIVVGDDDQSVYGWRYAAGFAGMDEWSKQEPTRVMELSMNFRSRQRIVETMQKLIANNSGRFKKASHISRINGSVEPIVGDDVTDELNVMLDAVESDPGSWAILSRWNENLDEIETRLIERGIPFSRRVKSEIWDTEIGGQVEMLIKYLNSPESTSNLVKMLEMMGLVKTGAFDSIHRWVTPLCALDAFVDEGEYLVGEYQRNLLDRLRGMNYAGRIDVRNIEHVTKQIMQWVLDMTADHKKLAILIQNRLIDKCGKISEWCSRKGQAYIRLRSLLPPKVEHSIRPGELSLLTIHGSKGMEFKNVWVFGNQMCRETSRDIAKSGEFEEERRLVYVAGTRAENRLVFSWNRIGLPTPFMGDMGLSDPEPWRSPG